MLDFPLSYIMDTQDALTQEPQYIQDLPVVQMMLQLIQSQAKQIQSQSEQIQSQSEQIQSQSEQICEFKKIIDKLKDEISRLKKTPKRPKFKPNKMHPRDRSKGGSQKNSSESNKNICTPDKKQEEITIKAHEVPQGSRFKGYKYFNVQDLEIIVKEITYKLEIWRTPDGKIIRAELPNELRGKHFGLDLRTLVINLYAQGMTQPAIDDLLQAMGIKISAAQINHILLEEADGFTNVSEDILQAGLSEAPYIRTDDTGARHKHKNGYCTHIGGKYFAYFKTTFSKSRVNFLNMFLQGRKGYRVNDAMIWHLYQCGIKDDVLSLFEEHKGKKYIGTKGFRCLLTSLRLRGKRLRTQCLEAALVGFISEEILKKGQVLLSDRAGQFAVFDHAACWVHMERPLRKIVPTSEAVKIELEQVRKAVWDLYYALKDAALTQTSRDEIEKEYDSLVKMKSTSPAIRRVIQSFHEYRDEMLKVLDHPGLPLHNNDSERDIRGFVKRRKISGSTKSEKGKNFRDGLATIKQTCFRLGISFWKYSSEWLRGKPPDLAQLVRDHYQAALP